MACPSEQFGTDCRRQWAQAPQLKDASVGRERGGANYSIRPLPAAIPGTTEARSYAATS